MRRAGAATRPGTEGGPPRPADRSPMKDVGATIAWLIGGAASAPTPEALLEELAGRLVADGLPLDRLAIFVSVLHPDIANRCFIWRRGRPVRTVELGYGNIDSENYPAGPVLVEVQRSGK